MEIDNILDEREKIFLHRIVTEFIEIGEPVSSRHIANLEGVTLSSASIRNIMWDLTEKGFLTQPHTSAGRIPTDLGYRFYVNELQKDKIYINNSSINYWKKIYNNESIEGFLKECLTILANDTKLASLATTPRPENLVLKSIEFINLNDHRILVLIVTNNGLVLNKIIRLRELISDSILLSLGNNLTKLFSNALISEIRDKIIQTLASSNFLKEDILFKSIVSLTKMALNLEEQYQIYFAGRMYITKWNNTSSIEVLNSIYKELEDGRHIKKVLIEQIEINNNVYFKIGNEIELKNFDNYALVAANYGAKDFNLGTIGVLGPKRMNYQKIAKIVQSLATTISNNFK